MENLRIIADNIIIPACKIGLGILPDDTMFNVDFFAHHLNDDFYIKNKKQSETKDTGVIIFEQTSQADFKRLLERNSEIFLETEEQVKKFVKNYNHLLANREFETWFFLRNSNNYPYVIQINNDSNIKKPSLKFNDAEFFLYGSTYLVEAKTRIVIPK